MKKSTFSSHRKESSRGEWSHFTKRRRTPNYAYKKQPWYKRMLRWGIFSIRRIIGGILMLGVIGIALIWGLVLRDLPDIRMIEQGNFFEENTVMYANDGTEFYSFASSGKRTYITYDDISPAIIDALISTEDQRFFENPGFDIFGLMRAGLNYAFGRDSQIRATSTLSQQLIKNTLLTNERSVKRKIQEAYLAYQLNQKYSKEKILEMYLNAIEFGHNANGVEQASKTFFGKSAKDVWPLGASILASLPKSPTRYSPYLHRDLLMGKIEAYPTDTPSHRVSLSLETANGAYAPVYHVFREYIKNLTFEAQGGAIVRVCHLNPKYNALPSLKIDSQGCANVGYADLIHVIGSIRVHGDLSIENHPAESYTIEYTVWRKDIVASLTFENRKIDGSTFGKIIYDGLEFQFEKPSGAIRYPYFVMYVKEYLENRYGKDMNIQKGLRVYTTLDPRLQEYAEQVIREQVETNTKKHGASSAALVSMDNKTGKLLAMVGGPDYFDVENGGNNNMTTALRQPWSSFKTIVYALAVSKNPIGIMSPVADVDTKFWTYAPQNYDGKFNGIMSLGSALAYSRNIPAVKMYFLAGKEEAIAEFADTLGIRTLKGGDFGASMALGAGEVRAIDMMQAYSVFANNGIKRDLYAIERIEDSQWNIIEQRSTGEDKEVFSPAASYIISRMLSDNALRPASSFWRETLTIPWKTVAAKTGTSNKPPKKWTSQILPGDTWTVGYSPTVTTVVWAGNVDGSPLKWGCDGINCAAPAWNKFMRKALADTPNIDFSAPTELIKTSIVKVSGLLPNDSTPKSEIISDIFAVPLKTVDGGYKEMYIDSLCGGPVTDATPEESILTVKTPTSKPIIDGYDPEWTKGFLAAIGSYVASTILDKTSTSACERPGAKWQITITSRLTGVTNNVLEINWSGNRAIQKFRVTVDGKIAKERDYTGQELTSGSDRINLQELKDANSITVDIIDVFGYKYSKSGAGNGNTPENTLPTLPSIIDEEENSPSAPWPSITISNPSRNSINIYAGDMFNLRFQTSIHTRRRTIEVAIDGNPLQTATSGEIFVIPVPTQNIAIGEHTVTITAKDANNRSDSRSFILNILPR